MTDKEIDEAVDLLLKQLEKVRKRAKSKLKKVKEVAK
jgi:ribosome-associated translation inhibitor RaiA